MSQQTQQRLSAQLDNQNVNKKKAFVGNKERGILPFIKEGHMASPAYLITVDRSVFKLTPEQRDELTEAKLNHRQLLKKFYGNKANKHLNIPSKTLPEPIINRF